MTATRRNEIIVGLFVVLGITALLLMTFIIKGNVGMSPYRIEVVYDDVAGLEIGSPVLVSGFRLGRVVEMEPERDEDGDPQVKVFAVVSRKIPIYQDATVALSQMGFLGDMRLEIYPGNEGAGEIENGMELESIPPLNIAEAVGDAEFIIDDVRSTLRGIRDFVNNPERIDRIDSIMANIDRSSSQVDGMLRENRANFKESLTNITEASRRADDLAEKADSVLAKANSQVDDLGTQVQSAIMQLRNDSRSLTRRLDDILSKADETNENANGLISESRQEIARISDRIRQNSDSVQELLNNLNEGKGTFGRLMVDPQPFEDLQQSIAAIKAFLLKEQETLYDSTLPYRSLDTTKGQGTAQGQRPDNGPDNAQP